MFEQLRGLAWCPGGLPFTQTRHRPGGGRCPGGMPRVADVLGLLRAAGRASGAGWVETTGVQAAAARSAMANPAIVAKRMAPPGRRADLRQSGTGRAGPGAALPPIGGSVLRSLRTTFRRPDDPT